MNDTFHNEPLRLSDKIKLICFVILLGVSILFLPNIIPILVIGIGYFYTRKTKNFAGVDISTKVALLYSGILAVVSLIYTGFSSVGLASEYHKAFEFYENGDDVARFLNHLVYFLLKIVGLIFFILYFLATKYLYFNVLAKHKGWVVLNGAFGKV